MSLKTLAARTEYLGGNQLNRIKKQKLESFRWALKNDYQTRMIKTPTCGVWPALINHDVAGLKADYDKKTISVEFDSGLEAGDVFECLDDNSHWMIYLPVLTETAYLRSEIIRCRYTIKIDDEVYWIYFQGSTETDIRWFQKQGVNMNELNYSGTIYIKLTPQTRAFFERFSRIKVDGHIWEVQVTDSISVPGVLELEVQEYYDNPIDELPEIHKVNEENVIVGQTTVKQDSSLGYYISRDYYSSKAKWSVTGNDRVELLEVLSNGNMCRVKIHQGAIGTYQVNYGDYSIECTIDWERNYINGPDEVRPYDIVTYKGAGTYSINTDLATIISQDGKSCKIEIITSRAGNFTLTCETPEGQNIELPIRIKSLFGGKDEKTIGVVS